MNLFLLYILFALICGSLTEEPNTTETNDPNSRTTGLLDWLNHNKNMVKDKLSFGAETMNLALGIGNNSLQLASSLGSNLIDEGTQYAKQGVQIATKFGLRGVNDSVGIAHQVVDLMERVPVVKHVTSYGRAGVEVAGNFSQNALNTLNKFKNRKLDFFNDIAQRSGIIFSNIASIGTSIGQALTTGGTDLLKSGIDGGLVVMEHAYDKIQGLNRMGHRFINTLKSVVYGSAGSSNETSATAGKIVQSVPVNQEVNDVPVNSNVVTPVVNPSGTSDDNVSVEPDSNESLDRISSVPRSISSAPRSIIQVPPRVPRY